jgi:Mn-containing catalase
MFLRIDKLQIELPLPKEPEPNAAAALQELLGGKYGEMSTLGNYLFQSFNFRSKSKLKPFYSLVANITAEELGHVELVSNGVALLNNGTGRAGRSGSRHQQRALRRYEGHPACRIVPVKRRRCHADE